MIRGHSGCNIEFKDGIAIKSSPNYPSKRLEAQARKQKRFSRRPYVGVRIPKVLHQYYIGDTFYFEMEYFNAIDMIQFFNTRSLECLQDFYYSVIEGFVCNNFNRSTMQRLDRAKLIAKYNTVKIDDRFDDLFYSDKELAIPEGPCHGDLTLSNILYCNGEFIIIDFLDSFMDTPLMDLAKLKQDTVFQWSLLLYDQPYNACRIDSIFNWVNERIEYYFCYSEALKLFEILNLLRILPYCKNKKIEQAVRQMLCQF